MYMVYEFVILSLFLYPVDTLPPHGDVFKFLAEDWRRNGSHSKIPLKMMHKGGAMVFNCTTNDPDADVYLRERTPGESQFRDSRTEKENRISKKDQTFVVDALQLRDRKEYECTARNASNGKISLLLGTLFVENVHVDEAPEIEPYSDRLLIEQNGAETIVCKTAGYSTLPTPLIQWHRELSNGMLQLLNGIHSHASQYVDLVTYKFTNFQETDAGTYICVKTVVSDDKKYVTKSKIVINMEDPVSPELSFPLFTSTNPVKTVNFSQRIEILCEATGSPTPTVYWMKGSKRILNCSHVECFLTLDSADLPHDSGVYSCVGENILNTTKKDITVVVQVPIKLDKSSNLHTATYEKDKTLSCEVLQGNPPPTIRWDYQVDNCESSDDCVPLDDQWKPVEKQSPGDDTPTMKSSIVSVKSRTNIFYRCTAQNVISKDVYNFKLIRSAQKNIVFTFSGSRLVNENEPMKIVCAIGLTYKSAVIQKVGRSNDTLETKVEKLNDTTVITYTKPVSELTDQGDYQCLATLARRDGVETKKLKIVVKKLLAPVILNMADKTVNQDITRQLRIVCNVSGNPLPTVKWKHKGIPLKLKGIDGISSCSNTIAGIYRKSRQHNTLILCKLDFERHSGLYECFATNPLGNSTKKMFLTIEASPKIPEKTWNDERAFGLNDPIAVKCEATANPPANVTWEKVDGNETTVVTGGQLNVNVLSFVEATEEHAGLYRCTAENKFGTNSRTVELSIKGTVKAVTSSKDSTATIIGIIIAFVAFIIIIFIVVFIYQRRLKKKYALYLEPNSKFKLDKDRTLFEQSSELPYDKAWEFPRERLSFIKTVGSGAFGQVWVAEAEGIHDFKPRDDSRDARKRRKSIQKKRGNHLKSFKYKSTTQTAEMLTIEKPMVAVKTLKDGAAEGEYKDLASELKILIHLGEHKNIVNLLGACTTGGNLCVILEYCPYGNLLTFLRARRKIFEPVWRKKHQTDMEKEFTYIDLLHIASQVARGMEFLESKKCVHRDVAARNVLVGDDYVMKIADFGLARDIYKDEIYLKQTTGLLPIKWMAPESLFDKVYTSSSDVWSFGILLWEIFTLGGSPYPGLPTEDLLKFLEGGKRMECPDRCPKDVYKIMYNCWVRNPDDRPLFAQLVEQLNDIMKHNALEVNANDYLAVEEDSYMNSSYLNTKQSGSEYQKATSSDATHPKGDSHVPLLTEVNKERADDS